MSCRSGVSCGACSLSSGRPMTGVSGRFQVVGRDDRVAVVGDGKLGLLVAQALVVQGVAGLVHFGKHAHKMRLVQGTRWELATDTTAAEHAQVCVAGCRIASLCGPTNSVLHFPLCCAPLVSGKACKPWWMPIFS